MIAFIDGILEAKLSGRVIVSSNGIGFNILVSESTINTLPAEGNRIKLYTYMNVREDSITLFGFISLEEQNLFNLLIGVSGVGPKGALNILGTYSVSDIKYFIICEDSKSLSKAPTIGKKIAEKIIIDLKDKINKEEILLIAHETDNAKVEMSQDVKDAIEALIALGYDKKAAENAISQIDHVEELDVNQILKLALKYMF